MGSIVINKTNGGLGKVLPNLDHVSGLIFWNSNKPVSFGTSKTKSYSNLIDVEADGIVKDSVNYSYEWYHISEFFRIQPNGKLYLHLATPSGTHNYNELLTIQADAQGEIRQVGIVATDTAFATAEIDKVQAHCNTLESAKTPVQVVMSFDYDAITVINDLPDLSALSTAAPNVSIVISQDGDNYGYSLSATNNAAIGATLGAISLASVYENIGWTSKFNVASSELNFPILAFGGIAYKDISVSDLGKLEDRNYLFLMKYSNQTGTYFNDDKTCDAPTSDYNKINLNRVINKAIRNLYDNLFPLINSPVKVTKGGLMTPGSVTTFESAASKAIGTMEDASEVSDYAVQVLNTTNLFQTPTVYINVRIRPIASVKDIVVSLGYDINI